MMNAEDRLLLIIGALLTAAIVGVFLLAILS